MAEVLGVDDHFARMQPRVPNRKKFEEEQASLLGVMKNKETEIKMLALTLEDKCQPDLEALRVSKVSLNQKRQSINEDLTRVNQEICKQEAELARVQSSLQYRNESKINEAIQRLETQLLTRNFTLTEEKKIVSEIDNLKRSKKNLGAYLILKKLTDEKRESARQMRSERDKLFKDLTNVRHQEDELKAEWQSGHESMTKLKHEIVEQQRKLHLLKKEFAEQEKTHSDWRRKHFAQVQKAKSLERKASEEAQQLERAELEATSDRFASERHLCTTLVNYLHQFLAPEDFLDKLMTTSLPANLIHYLQDSSRGLESKGMVRLQRKSDDEEQYMNYVKPKTTRKLKKDKKKVFSRKLIFTPDILAQFTQLDMSPPLSVAEVPTAIEQLVSRLAEINLSQSNVKEQVTANVHSGDGAANLSITVDNVPSSAASYTGSSVPTTPDVQTDTAPRLVVSVTDSPLTAVSRVCSGDSASLDATVCSRDEDCSEPVKRRLSHDSGAYELDELCCIDS